MSNAKVCNYVVFAGHKYQKEWRYRYEFRCRLDLDTAATIHVNRCVCIYIFIYIHITPYYIFTHLETHTHRATLFIRDSSHRSGLLWRSRLIQARWFISLTTLVGRSPQRLSASPRKTSWPSASRISGCWGWIANGLLFYRVLTVEG